MKNSKRKTLTIFLSRLKCSLLLFVLLYSNSTTLLSQSELYSINSVWDDSATEWKLYGWDNDGEDIEGELRIKWGLRNDFSEWIADYNEQYITIRQKYNNDNTRWELRSDSGIIIDIKSKWRGDNTEWTISSGDQKIKWHSEYRNDLNLWYFEDENIGYMEMITYENNDSRDWEIIDNAATITDEMKIAALFITLYNTTPKR